MSLVNYIRRYLNISGFARMEWRLWDCHE